MDVKLIEFSVSPIIDIDIAITTSLTVKNGKHLCPAYIRYLLVEGANIEVKPLVDYGSLLGTGGI